MPRFLKLSTLAVLFGFGVWHCNCGGCRFGFLASFASLQTTTPGCEESMKRTWSTMRCSAIALLLQSSRLVAAVAASLGGTGHLRTINSNGYNKDKTNCLQSPM
jgi:hypothetical protein